MSKFKQQLKLKPRTYNSKRQELEVEPTLLFILAAAIFVITYAVIGLLPPLRQSYIGVLLFERGFIQAITVAFAAVVVAFTILKFLLLRQEYTALNKIWIADHIPLDQPQSHEVDYFQQRLIKDGNLIAVRCGRVIKAYIKSGDRATANEFALDDSAFYVTGSEASYSIPKIFGWAIPLLGFIGTVVGISGAVSGFTSFMQNSTDVEQIKEGVGQVTSNLAVAFDTTLLSLFLSVLVMIPLVLIERYETKLLLGIDMFINDKLLPRLKKNNQELDSNSINHSVEAAIKEYFPNPQDLVAPAQSYAEQAAMRLSTGFIAEVSKVQDVSSQIINQVAEIRQQAQGDRQQFLDFFARQQQINHDLVQQITIIVDEIRNKNLAVTQNLNTQTQGISDQLEKAARILDSRVASLESTTQKLTDFHLSQSGIEPTFASYEKTAQLEEVLKGVRDNLSQLQPLLKQLNKPRRITLLEQDNGRLEFE